MDEFINVVILNGFLILTFAGLFLAGARLED